MRVFVADDDQNVLQALLLFLEHIPGVEVVGFTQSLNGLLSRVEAAQPDIVMVDWEMIERREGQFFDQLRVNSNAPCIVAASSRPEARRLALLAGADDFVSKADPPDDLLAIFRRCCAKLTGVSSCLV